jgi:glutathione-regulated potassium-efflux system ancillary protein KefG
MPHTVDTLILLFHPSYDRSLANRALSTAAQKLLGVAVVDMCALYPDSIVDTDVEVARLLSAKRIVLQFPVQWYSTPALLKAWQDAVLTRMFYINEAEGKLLEGTPLMVVTTAGNAASAYAAGGVNLFSLAELLRPLQATAYRCGLPWTEPFLLYEANKLSKDALNRASDDYVKQLIQWTEANI